MAVLYGPFSALYAGNSLGGVVLFTTKLPERPTASIKLQAFRHSFNRYGSDLDLEGSSVFASAGGRAGRLSASVFYNRLENESAPTTFNVLSLSATAAPASSAARATGVFSDLDPFGQPRLVYGAESPTEAEHDLLKLKLGWELSPDLHLRSTTAYWRNRESRRDPQTYLRDESGGQIWSGPVETGGRGFTVAPAAFSLAERRQEDLVQGVTLAFEPADGFQALLSASAVSVLKDDQASSSGPLPAARRGGPGLSAELGRTGWRTLDLTLGHRASAGIGAAHAPVLGFHADTFFTAAEQHALADWRDRTSRTALRNGDGGRTSTRAFFAQDSWTFAPGWTFTPGLRLERWKATGGYRAADLGPAGNPVRVRTAFPDRVETGLSPKAALTWIPRRDWSVRLSLAEAHRFPTPGELFQGSFGSDGSIVNNDPNLRPERAFDKDLTVERGGEGFRLRASLFEEDVRDALLSQSSLRPDGTSFTGTQNLGRVRTRGVELGFDALRLGPVEFGAAVSYTDAVVLKNPGLPASEGKQVPRIPYWQTRFSAAWRPLAWLTIHSQARTAGRQYNTLENNDPLGGYGGVDAYFVVDAKITAEFGRGTRFSLGCDNLGDFRYHVFHPMSERTVTAELGWTY